MSQTQNDQPQLDPLVKAALRHAANLPAAFRPRDTLTASAVDERGLGPWNRIWLAPSIAAFVVLIVVAGTYLAIQGPAPSKRSNSLTPTPSQSVSLDTVITATGKLSDCAQRLLDVTLSVPTAEFARGQVVPVTIKVHNPGGPCPTTLLNPAGLVVAADGHTIYTSCTASDGNTPCTGDDPVQMLPAGGSGQTMVQWDTSGLPGTQREGISLEKYGLTLRIVVQ